MTHTVKQEAQDDEDVLWAKFRGGDIHAYSKIYHTYYALLYNYGYNIFTDRELVKDALQDLFLELWQRREGLGKIKSLQFYLLVSFRRKVLHTVRTQKKEALRVSEPLFVVHSYESDLIKEEMLEAQTMQLTKELCKLPSRQKEAIYLKFYQELSYLQITEVMCLKYQTVRDLIYKGLKQLRQKLGA